MATIEVANVDQLKLSPDSRWERAKVVLLRPDYEWSQKRTELPALMILGYSNLPQDFDEHLPDFEKLLGQLNLPTSGGGCFVAPRQPEASSPASDDTSNSEENEAAAEEPGEPAEPQEEGARDEVEASETAEPPDADGTADPAETE